MSTDKNARKQSAGPRRRRKVNSSQTQAHAKKQGATKGKQRRKKVASGTAKAVANRPSSGSTGSLSSTSSSLRTNEAVGYTSRASKKRPVAKHAAPSHAVPVRRGFPVWAIILIIVLVIGLGAGGFFLVSRFVNPSEGASVPDGQEVTVVIPEGSSGTDIVNILLENGVIRSSKDFKKATQEQQADQSFKPGTYTFLAGSDPAEVVAQLVKGPNSSKGQLQVPEGLTVDQTASLVEDSLGIKADDFKNQAKASNYVNDYSFLKDAGNDSLEGFLYPKTYDLSGKDVNADVIIRMMLDQYKQEFETLDLTSAQKSLAERYNLNVTDYDILKIASIIEKEAINEEDRPKVASVFYNRLSAGMALESDATMGYVRNGNATAEDLKEDSAYNTYLHKGLPPTPICSPSQWAIQAAMDPADTKYYFFFIIEDGVYSNHTFSEDYETHSAAYAKALEEQKAANGQPTDSEATTTEEKTEE